MNQIASDPACSRHLKLPCCEQSFFQAAASCVGSAPVQFSLLPVIALCDPIPLQVYSVLKLDKLAKLVPFASLSEIETIIVDAIRHGESTWCFMQCSCCVANMLFSVVELGPRSLKADWHSHSAQLVCPASSHSLSQICQSSATSCLWHPNCWRFRSTGYLAVRLDHRAGTLRFGAPGLDSTRMRDHIAVMARRLSTAQRLIQPDADPALEQLRLQVPSWN